LDSSGCFFLTKHAEISKIEAFLLSKFGIGHDKFVSCPSFIKSLEEITVRLEIAANFISIESISVI
jgi:hypothetical protein